MNNELPPGGVDARPEKRFFISMLVKDIELVPAILDLVDNSVDGALALRPGREFEGLTIDLEVTPERFAITDNCGGISLQRARDYAFRFGRPAEVQGVEGSVGEFGVGMKRALFKLGNHFRVESSTDSSRFVIDVHVPTWQQDDDPSWTFPLEVADENYTGELTGTQITVTELHATVAEDFESTGVIATLAAELRLRHMDALSRHLAVTLNGVRLTAFEPRLIASAEVRPVHRSTWFDHDGDRVELELFAGIAGQGDDADEGNAEDFQTPSRAGWYVFANNRLLLEADRSDLTGWGLGPAAYHPQYRRFRGYAYLSGPSRALPWNTTKTNVDQDSRVFRWTRAQLEAALQSVQTVINRAKREKQGRPPEQQVLNRALDAAPEVTLPEIEPSPAFRTPEPMTGGRPDVQSISYNVPRDEYEAAREALGAASAPEVGRATFRYFYERQVH